MNEGNSGVVQAPARPAPVTANRLPGAARDRRPALVLLALLLVLVGGFGSALLAYRSGQRVDVLMARTDIAAGQQVTADDFTVARVASDSTTLVSSAALANFVGTYALSSVPQGTLINRLMFTRTGAVPAGGALVGVSLDPSRRPATPPKVGDVVRLVFVSGKSNQSASDVAPGDVVVPAARVIAVASGSSTGAGSGTTTVTVLVAESTAGTVAQFGSAGQLALVVLPLSAKPSVDLPTG